MNKEQPQKVPRGETHPEYNICRECYKTGATRLGNDGWMRHEDCADNVNSWPNREGSERILGARVVTYTGGRVQIVPSLRYRSNRLSITYLAETIAENGIDYETLVPSAEFPANGENDYEIVRSET